MEPLLPGVLKALLFMCSSSTKLQQRKAKERKREGERERGNERRERRWRRAKGDRARERREIEKRQKDKIKVLRQQGLQGALQFKSARSPP